MKGADGLVFEDDRYLRLAAELRETYASADPFPHVVIDDFLPADLCRAVAAEFPRPDDLEWVRRERRTAIKLGFRDELQMGPTTRQVLWQLNSSPCVRFLEELTGIAGLIPDPHFDGGGLHQIERGGFLKIHADFNKHAELDLDRRLNLLLYLNEGWREEWGGALELWDRSMSRCVQRVLPVFNRCVVFSTTDFSYHGHPEPLACPPGTTRRSLALYYFSNGRPEQEVSPRHSTLYQERALAPPRFAGPRRLAARLLDLGSQGFGRITRALRDASDRVSPPF